MRYANRYVPACLTDTFRSQGFPPSQRFGPRVSSWLYFKPHPLIGFLAFRAFSTVTSRNASRHPFALVPLAEDQQHTRSLRARCTHRPCGASLRLTSELCSGSVFVTPYTSGLMVEPLLSWPSSPPRFAGPAGRPETGLPSCTSGLAVKRGNHIHTVSTLYFRVSNQSNRGSTSAEAEPTPLRFATLHERLPSCYPKVSGRLGTPIPNIRSRKSDHQFRPTTVRPPVEYIS
jgi:hypothetical protein